MIILMILLCIIPTRSFTIKFSSSHFTSTSTQLNAIEVPSLEVLDDNHEKEASRLAKSITGWLDDEWMPQEVHVQMAESAASSFIRARNDGETEVRIKSSAKHWFQLILLRLQTRVRIFIKFPHHSLIAIF